MNLSVSAHHIQLSFQEGEGMILRDLSSGQKWFWPQDTLGAAKIEKLHHWVSPFFEKDFCGTDQIELTPFQQWTIQNVSHENQTLKLECSGDVGRIEQFWELDSIGLNVRTHVLEWDYGQTDIRLLSPGLVRSESGPSPAVLPIYQGILHHQGDYAALISPGSHGRYQLGFAGLLGSSGGLSSIVDLNWDYNLYVRARDNLHDTLAYAPRISFGKYADSYTTRFRLCRPSVYDLAQTYREQKQAEGEFVTWEQKLKLTPGLEQMFGAPHFFIGYLESNHDYLGSLKKTKEMGFEHAFVYPTVFRSYNPEMQLKDGVKWIDISSLHEDIMNLGYHIASWSWPEEVAIQPNSNRGLWGILGHDQEGNYHGGWATGDYQWYSVAGDAQVQFMHWAQKNMWPELTAQHFDVTGNKVLDYIYGTKKFNYAADVECRNNVFAQAARMGPVSTEGFCDGFQQNIHCGSVMAYPSYADRDWWTVPLNSIVFHDSAMNVWWECDSYNNPYHQQQHYRNRHVTPAGGGKALEQSLWDALQGSPPNVFLCGKMYRPADNVYFSKGYEFYDIYFNDDATQNALNLAKPVADLHKKVGMQRIVGYDILTKDGSVHQTKFEDGTVTTVNFGNYDWSNGLQVYKTKSWSLN